MKRRIKFFSNNKGSAALLGSVSLGLLITSLLGILYMAEGAHQRIIIKTASTLESYYSNEVAQWNGYERTSQGSDVGIAPDGHGYYDCNLSTSYAPILPGVNTLFPSEVYDPVAPEGFTYSLKITSQYDTIGALNRRLGIGNLHYQVINK